MLAKAFDGLVQRRIEARAQEVFPQLIAFIDIDTLTVMAKNQELASQFVKSEHLDSLELELDNMPSEQDRRYWREVAKVLMGYENADFIAYLGKHSDPHNRVILKNYEWACRFLDDLRVLIRPYVDKPPKTG